MIRVSRSPLRFFQAESLGRRVRDGFRRGQTSVSPKFPRYAQKFSLTHRRLSHTDEIRKFY
jgi:hypothetical protein